MVVPLLGTELQMIAEPKWRFNLSFGNSEASGGGGVLGFEKGLKAMEKTWQMKEERWSREGIYHEAADGEGRFIGVSFKTGGWRIGDTDASFKVGGGRSSLSETGGRYLGFKLWLGGNEADGEAPSSCRLLSQPKIRMTGEKERSQLQKSRSRLRSSDSAVIYAWGGDIGSRRQRHEVNIGGLLG